MSSRQPWKTYPERWNRQIIYRFPNGYGASIIRPPIRDDVVEVTVICFPGDGDESDLALDDDGEQIIWREVPTRDVDAILDEIELMGAPEATA